DGSTDPQACMASRQHSTGLPVGSSGGAGITTPSGLDASAKRSPEVRRAVSRDETTARAAEIEEVEAEDALAEAPQVGADLQLVLPWRNVKRFLQSVGISKAAPSDSTSVRTPQASRQASQTAGASPPSGHVLPVTIPHGFQATRTIHHAKPAIRSALYVPSTNSDSFAILDAHRVTLLRGAVRAASHSTTDPGSPTAGLCKWLYIRKWRVVAAATMHLELKVGGKEGREGKNLISLTLVSQLCALCSWLIASGTWFGGAGQFDKFFAVTNSGSNFPPQPFLIVSCEDGAIRLWNLESGHCAYKWDIFMRFATY
ncbi:hypothetical protein HK405_006494, partial [Cladochytrium tenue]